MRGVPLHIYCIHFSQQTDPMGSGRPPWEAGEYGYFSILHTKVVTWFAWSNMNSPVQVEVPNGPATFQNVHGFNPIISLPSGQRA